MSEKSDFLRVVISSIIIGLLMISLFLIAKTEAQTPPATLIAPDSSDYSKILPSPTPTPFSQIQIWGGQSTTVTGNAYMQLVTCGPTQYNAIDTFTEIGGTQNIQYQYVTSFWGVGTPHSDTATNMLTAPATYNLDCIINEPQVQWVTSP